ncbi:MAG: serine hydrolase domain-containing protein [Campylobacterota bacterium]|nr:serine hydrolase domain-containing protein [Campylobacterota bacterium]
MKQYAKKFYTILLIILTLFIVIGCGSQSSAKINYLKTGNSFNQNEVDLIFLHTKIFPENTQLSIAKIQNGSVYFYGVLRRDDIIETIENYDKVFEIGSLTKLFTSTLLTNLVLEEKLKLDDTIHEKSNILLNQNPRITYKQLANHTSGAPRWPTFWFRYLTNNPFKNYDYKRLEDDLKFDLKLNNKPGEVYSYSNYGVSALGYALSKIENRSYEDLIQEKILSKLNMKSTTTIRKNIQTNLVIGLDENGNHADNWDMIAFESAGAILSSVEDLSKFANASFDHSNKAFKLTQIPSFWKNDHFGVGLGWHISKTDYSETLHWHNGATGGYISSIVLDIKNKNGIIILSNVSLFNKNNKNIEELGLNLLKLMYK